MNDPSSWSDNAFAEKILHQFPVSEVQDYQHQLQEIERTLVDGKFVNDEKSAPAGQDVVVGLLHRCLLWADITLQR